MGYDMYWVDADHNRDEAYFRLNIWSMGRYVDAMHRLGAVQDGYDMSAAPPWPEDIPDGYWDWEYKKDAAEVDDDTRQRYEAIEAQYRARQEWSPPVGTPTIPAHKFGTNDGWIVTPQECFHAAETIRAADPQAVAGVLAEVGIKDSGYWDKWVDWLAEAGKHGGVEVH